MNRRDRKSVIDPDDLIRAVEDSVFGLSNIGFCIKCGYEQDGCEPDARNYECEECEARAVFGAEELLVMGYAE